MKNSLIIKTSNEKITYFICQTLTFEFVLVLENFNLEQAGAWFPIAHQLLPAKAEVAREWIGQRRAGMRGWRDFCKSDKFRLPAGPSIASRRIVMNVEH